MPIDYRKLQQKDNPIISRIIKNALEEHGVAQPGTVYTDPTTDDLFTLFSREDAVYFIAEENGVMLGGCGVYPTIGLPEGCAELVKLYVSKEGRGKGIGSELIEFASPKKIRCKTDVKFGNPLGFYLKMGFSGMQLTFDNEPSKTGKNNNIIILDRVKP